MSVFRRQLRFWSIWTLTTAIVLIANPWGEPGPIEMLAVLGPFLLVIPRQVWREATLAIGLPLLTLAWLSYPGDSSVLRLLCAWTVFSGGVILAARVLESQRELESIVGFVAYHDRSDQRAISESPISRDQATAKQLRESIERELGRARRHDRRFAVLSAAVQPRSLEADSAGLLRSELLQSLAENRARLELQDLLRAELHLYCDVAIDGSRVLALVPEIDHDALALLLERLKNSADEKLNFEIQIGAGAFPADAVCADDLIEAADRTRKASKLRSLSERKTVDQGIDEPALRSPDVQA